MWFKPPPGRAGRGACSPWQAISDSSTRSGAATKSPSKSYSSVTGRRILGFCRHMLGSAEEAEDAVQHTFAAAYRDLARADEREIVLKPWLFAIARNRCISIFRARREQPSANQ